MSEAHKKPTHLRGRLFLAFPANVHILPHAQRCAEESEERPVGAALPEGAQRGVVDVIIGVHAALFLELVLQELELLLGQRPALLVRSFAVEPDHRSLALHHTHRDDLRWPIPQAARLGSGWARRYDGRDAIVGEERTAVKLSAQQVAYFQTFGFLKFPGLLADVIGDIIDAFEGIWAEHGGGHHGKPHDGRARSTIVPFIDQSERLCALLDDERIVGIASSLLGDDFNYTGSDGNYYVGDTNWHSDGWHPKYIYVKIGLYLDPLTRDTGCLRLIPGSHRIGDAFADALQARLRTSE